MLIGEPASSMLPCLCTLYVQRKLPLRVYVKLLNVVYVK